MTVETAQIDMAALSGGNIASEASGFADSARSSWRPGGDEARIQHSASPVTSRAKRICDVFFALAAIIAFLPVLFLITVLIRLDSPGPVIFRQRRGGLHGVAFEIYKFRTMHSNMGASSASHATKGDARLTRIGGFLRRSSLDELPQFFNVLKGDMSIVGPRPHAVEHDAYYAARIADYSARMGVKPGLTGLAQVSGYRGEIRKLEDMANRVICDIQYQRTWSLWLDLKLIFLTVIRSPFDPQAY